MMRSVLIKIEDSRIKKILYNSSWLLIDKTLKILLGIFVGAWVARYLAPDSFGKLSYVLSFIAFFQAIANLGLNGITVRDLSSSKYKKEIILGTVLRLRIIASVILWLVLLIIIGICYGISNDIFILSILSGGVLIFQVSDTVDLWFQSQSQSKRTVKIKVLSYLLSNGIKIAFILLKLPLIYFGLVFSIEAMIVSLGLFLSYKQFKTENQWSFNSILAKNMLLESWPFILSGLSIMIYMRIDQIMIMNMMDAIDLGIYSSILPLSTSWNFIPIILFTSIAPILANIKKEDLEKYYHFLYNTFRLFSLISTLLCICVVLCSHYVVNLLYGKEYISGSMILSIHIFTNIFIFLGVAQELWILNERKSILSLYKTLIGATVCILGNIIFIPRYGLIGAAYVAVFSQAMSACFTNLFFARKIFCMQILSIFQIKYSLTKKIMEDK